jgi:YVTN family beta-propeller protein
MLRRLVMPAALMSLAAGLGLAVPGPQAVADAARITALPGSPAVQGSPVTAYVVNEASWTVTPIATATNTAGPPIAAGQEPNDIAITPDGATAYVSDVLSGTVTVITTATNISGPRIIVGSHPGLKLQHLVVTPDGKTVYVASFILGQPEAGVTPIATATNTAGPLIMTHKGAQYVVVTPDGKTAYVANSYAGSVSPIATATNTAGPGILTGGFPVAIAITPNGRTAYVANNGSGTVTPIATATNTAGPPIAVGTGPVAIAITPNGRTAYVVNNGSGTVTPITTATNTAGPPITVGTSPVAIAITPVTRAPAFTSGSAATAAYRTPFRFTVTAIGDPAPTITRTGRLPSGVRFIDHQNGTATISGTPRRAAAGVYRVTLTARNRYGTATQAFTLTVTRAPAIQKIRTVRTRAGAVLRLTIRAAGYPAPALAESGPLPGGLTFTDNGNGTATIAGTVAAASRGGRYPVIITATNTEGTATRRFKIVVSWHPGDE